jgi:nitrilase
MKKAQPEYITVAAVQATPVFLDLEATLDKVCLLIGELGRKNVDLAVFPEAMLPGYPVWCWFIPPGHTKPLRELYAKLHANSLTVPGPATDRLCDAAREAGVTVAIGINEINSEGSGGTLYNTLLYIGADGRILGKHRKFVPTAGERLVWGRGDGSDLDVYDTPFGKLGGLLCWEHYMPLARYALSAWGIQVHAAPTWDRGEPWLSTLRHVAKESRCVVIGSCQPFRKDDIPDDFAFKEKYLADIKDWINPGGSVIVNPDGKMLTGPMMEEECMLIAKIRRDELIGPRWQLDVAGNYARPDVFELHMRRTPTPGLRETPDTLSPVFPETPPSLPDIDG